MDIDRYERKDPDCLQCEYHVNCELFLRFGMDICVEFMKDESIPESISFDQTMKIFDRLGLVLLDRYELIESDCRLSLANHNYNVALSTCIDVFA